jgi:hypothetical protein
MDPGRDGRSSRRRFLVALTLVAVVSGVLIALAPRNHSMRTTLGAPPATTPPEEEGIRRLPDIARISIGGVVMDKPVAAQGAYWSVASLGGTGPLALVRVDADDLRARTLTIPGQPHAVAAGFDSVWAATCLGTEPPTEPGWCADGAVLRLDPDTGEVTGTAKIGGQVDAIAAGEGRVWVSSRAPTGDGFAVDSVVAIDPADLGTIAYPLSSLGKRRACCIRSLTAAEGAVWMVLDRLVRFDPATGALTELPVHPLSETIEAGAGGIWSVGSEVSPSTPGFLGLMRLDPGTNRVVERIGEMEGVQFAIGGSALWLARRDVREVGPATIALVRLVPGTGDPGPLLRLSIGPSAGFPRYGLYTPSAPVAYGEGAVWVFDEDAGQVIRVADSPFPPAPSGAFVTRLGVDGLPVGRPAFDSSLWTLLQDRDSVDVSLLHMADNFDPRILRLDGATVRSVAAGFDGIWVAVCPTRPGGYRCDNGSVLRISPYNFGIEARIPIGGEPFPIATGEGAVWVGREAGGVPDLVQIDPNTNRVVRTIPLGTLEAGRAGCCVRDLAAGEGGVWLLFGTRWRLARVDPVDGRLAELEVYGGQVEVGEDAVWVRGRTTPMVSEPEGVLRIDPRTLQVVAHLDGVSGVLAAGGGWIWLAEAMSDGQTIVIRRIDPATNQLAVVTQLHAPPTDLSLELPFGRPFGMAYGRGSVWVTLVDAHEVIRVEPPEFIPQELSAP